jgi:hypothetical protein
MVASILIYFLLFTLLAVNLQFTLSEENGDDIKALIADMSLETIMKELKDREIECVACVSREDYAERLEMVWTAPNKRAHKEFLSKSRQKHENIKELIKMRRTLERKGMLSHVSPEDLNSMDADELRRMLKEVKREQEISNADVKAKKEEERRNMKSAEAFQRAEKEMKMAQKAKRGSKGKGKEKGKGKNGKKRRGSKSSKVREKERIRRSMADNVIEEDYYSQYYGSDETGQEVEEGERIEL